MSSSRDNQRSLGLDEILKDILSIYKNKTVLFISHRLSSLKNADQILVMDQGALMEQGTHTELLAMKGRYSTLYSQQETGN